jgi:hypothetical protein
MKFSALILTALALEGCAVLPNSVGPEFEHMSHATQHEPLTDHPTNYGAEIASVVAHWDVTDRLKIEVAEGVDLDRHWSSGTNAGNGEILGPREEFSGRVQYLFPVRP